MMPSPYSSVSRVLGLRKGGRWFDPLARPIFFLRTYDSHCNRINSSINNVHCFNDSYVGKKANGMEKYCGEYWLKELRKAQTGALAAAISESKESTRLLALTRKNLVRASGLSFFV